MGLFTKYFQEKILVSHLGILSTECQKSECHKYILAHLTMLKIGLVKQYQSAHNIALYENVFQVPV